MNNITADITNYNERVQTGKRIELLILNSLRSTGMKIDSASSFEDMRLKIDGWIINSDSTRHSLQIKYRETGDDIIFEILKDWDKRVNGRDSVSNAEFYLVVDRKGCAKLINTSEIKLWALKLRELATSDTLRYPNKVAWVGKTHFVVSWEMKITIDRASGNRKLMGYFNPSLFTATKEYRNLI